MAGQLLRKTLMAIGLDPSTRVISVPQSDLTLVTGTLYEMDTDVFRKAVWDLLSSEPYIWMPPAFTHNSEVTVAGTTFARTLEFINSYSIQFTPNTPWSVRLTNSNNNIFDIENGILVQNMVQVIPTNSAGLIVSNALGALTPEQGETLDLIRYAVAGNAEVSADNLTVTIKDDNGTPVQTLNVSSDGRVRTIQ